MATASEGQIAWLGLIVLKDNFICIYLLNVFIWYLAMGYRGRIKTNA